MQTKYCKIELSNKNMLKMPYFPQNLGRELLKLINLVKRLTRQFGAQFFFIAIPHSKYLY